MWAQDKACFILDSLINLEIFPYKYLKMFIYQDVAMAIDEIHIDLELTFFSRQNKVNES